MIHFFILFTIALFALNYSWKKGTKKELIQSIGFLIGLILSRFDSPEIKLLGLLIFSISTVYFVSTNINSQSSSLLHKFSCSSAGITLLFIHVFSIFHLPYASELMIISIIPPLIYGISLFFGITKNKSFGNVTLINAMLLSHWF